MIKLMKAKEIKYIGVIIIIILIIFKFFNTPYNFYSILNWNYEKRMEQNYGFCKNESWGFYNHVIKKFDLSGQEINTINDEGHVTLENLFDIKKSKDNKSNFLILTNYQSENNNDIFNNQYEFLKNYKILYRKNNCYLLKSND
tara:strand:- start:1088 stop:1516 length:429 start_codon:yes stop_codon:yes gene_type:complete